MFDVKFIHNAAINPHFMCSEPLNSDKDDGAWKSRILSIHPPPPPKPYNYRVKKGNVHAVPVKEKGLGKKAIIQ